MGYPIPMNALKRQKLSVISILKWVIGLMIGIILASFGAWQAFAKDRPDRHAVEAMIEGSVAPIEARLDANETQDARLYDAVDSTNQTLQHFIIEQSVMNQRLKDLIETLEE